MEAMESKLSLDKKDFFYQDTAIPVINDILAFVKSLKSPAKKTFENIWSYPIDPDVWFDLHEDAGYALYYVNVSVESVDFESGHPGWNINATAGVNSSNEATIDVQVQLSPERFGDAKILPRLRSELYNVVPHEMHHLTQSDGPFQRVSCPLTTNAGNTGNFNYFMSSCEIPAFVIGFRGEAFESGRSMEEIINVYLNNQQKANLITAQELGKIKKAWMSHSSWHSSSNESIVREYIRLLAGVQQ